MKWIARRGRPSKVSVDVFDTVMTRRVGEPKAVFDLLGSDLAIRGALGVPGHRFRFHRWSVERDLSRADRGNDIPLAAIYAELSRRGVVTDDPTSALEVELEWERRLTCVLPANPLSALRRRSPDGLVHFLSDSPHGAAWLTNRLTDLSLCRPGDRVTTSADVGRTKRSGELFTSEIGGPGTMRRGWLHCGNDERSDGRAARRAGLRTWPHDAGNLTLFESRLERIAADIGPFASFCAGASRLARTEVASQHRNSSALLSVASGILAPCVAAYVLWLSDHAVRHGIDRMYFVARDGHVLKTMAEHLFPVRGLADIELRYLYGSREAWNLPSFTEMDAHATSWIFEGKRDLTLRLLAQRLGIDLEVLLHHVPMSSLGGVGEDEPFGQRADSVIAAICASDTLWEVVATQAAPRRDLMLRYLRSEGLDHAGRYALVDLGWAGRMGRSLQKVLTSADLDVPTIAYCGLKNLDPAVGPVHATAFYFDGRAEAGAFPGELEFLEYACLAPHGQTVGYAADETGKVVPTIDGVDRGLRQWGMDSVLACMDAFGCHLAETMRLVGADHHPAGPALQALARLTLPQCRSLTGAEARVWADFPHETQQTGRPSPIAPRLSVREALRGDGGRWKDIRAARSPVHVRLAVKVRRRVAKLR